MGIDLFSLERRIKRMAITTGFEIIEKNPEKNVNKLFEIAEKVSKDEITKSAIINIKNYYNEMPSVKEYIQDILKTTNRNCLKKFYSNFAGNAVWYGMPKREKLGQEEDAKIPFALLISPSMRCNLRCTGCYAANYSKKDDISNEEIERLIKEAREMGIYYIVVLGGEPFFNEYMLDIYKKYNDMYFMPFTNGTLFNEKLADELAELGNVMPMFSIEGWAEDTDKRRGDGVFASVIKGMELLEKRGVLFGASAATSNSNIYTVTSDAFIDMLVEKGARMLWYFMFMPIGDNPIEDMNYMLSPKERIYLGKRNREIRTHKKIFTIDFFNDAPYVGGCIAGKYYCHINSKQDVEPCIFSHFATTNIKEKPLMDAFKAPYFKNLINKQPYNKNLLMPCPMIDNPQNIRDIIKENGAYPTHPSADLMVKDENFMKKLDKLAEDFKPYADKAYAEDFNNSGNYEMSKG